MLLKEILGELEKALAAAAFESAALEASIIVADSLGVPQMELPLQRKRKLSAEDERKIRDALARRLNREPLQYIFGSAYFRLLKVKVGPGCLIPRPETETLAEIVMKFAPEGGSVCELGAGSGALSLSIATERPDLQVFASEISPEAFKWADLNRRESGAKNFELRSGDLLEPFKGMRFDAIVANLPYIPSEDMHGLSPDVRLREPEKALDGGPDGLSIIRRAVAQTPESLKPGGLLALEMAETHGEALLEILKANKAFASARIEKDLFGKDRFALASLGLR